MFKQVFPVAFNKHKFGFNAIKLSIKKNKNDDAIDLNIASDILMFFVEVQMTVEQFTIYRM